MSVSFSQAVGAAYSVEKMRHAQAQTWRAIERIAPQIHAGISEGEACVLAREVLRDMGMDRAWHQVIVRLGKNTLKTFSQRINPETVLGENDIFFIDLGVVWHGIEGDAGATFSVGSNPSMHDCAAAVRIIWEESAQYWRESRCNGVALYRYAAECAARRGWLLNGEIKGHRVSEFPHKTYQAGDLGDLNACPASGVWVLEIQLRHPEHDFGAFYEDVLWDDA